MPGVIPELFDAWERATYPFSLHLVMAQSHGKARKTEYVCQSSGVDFKNLNQAHN